jgi:hypothetical protein
MPPHPQTRPAGFFALGAFFFFGAMMATLAATTLLRPGTMLDRAWVLNRPGHDQLASVGRWIGIPFLIFAVVLFLAGLGWFKRRRWGWLLGVGVIAVNLIGDLIHFIAGDWLRSTVGVVIAGALLVYITRPRLRVYFQ